MERGFVRVEVWRPNDPRIIRSDDDAKRAVQVAVLVTGALRDYEMQRGERVGVEAALWLFEHRQRPERAGLLTPATWCVVCGAGCLDTRPNPSRIRQRCDACSKRRARPGLRWCAAADCPESFLATHAADIYCSGACAKAEQRRARSALTR